MKLTVDIVLQRLFRSMHRLEKLMKMSSVELIVNNEKRLINTRKGWLNKNGLDINAYLNTPQGQAAYLLYTTHLEHEESLSNRCGKCALYFKKSKSKEEPFFGCLKFENLPMRCSEFIDTGKDCIERLFRSQDRCSTCHFFMKEDLYCSKNLNEFDMSCSNIQTTTQNNKYGKRER